MPVLRFAGSFWLMMYSLPVLIAVLRRFRKPDESWASFALVLAALAVAPLVGIPFIGWLIAWFLALRGLDLRSSRAAGDDRSRLPPGWRPPPFVPPNVVEPAEPTSQAPPSTPSPAGWTSPPEDRPCPKCGRTGRVTCPSCHGRATWWTQPVGASGQSTLQGCDYCVRSGTVQCLDCGGSGKARY